MVFSRSVTFLLFQQTPREEEGETQATGFALEDPQGRGGGDTSNWICFGKSLSLEA